MRAGGAIVRRDHVLDGADEVLQRRVHRAQIGDEAARPAQLGAERAVKAEIGSENLARLRLVGLVPDHVVEALDEVARRRRHATSLPFAVGAKFRPRLGRVSWQFATAVAGAAKGIDSTAAMPVNRGKNSEEEAT